MIIKSYETEKIKNINSKLILLYGENDGFKNEVFKDFFIKDFKGEIDRTEENDVLNNFDQFFSNLANKSFFTNSRIILISRVTDKIIKLVDNFLEKNIDDVKIIFIANILEKKSKLRSKFEKEKNLVCIPFYKDDSRALNQIANKFFKNNKISVSQEIINLIVERSSGDRTNLNNELEKISLFMINRKKINIEDIFKLTNLAENYSISELADNCLSKNLNKVNKILNENIFSTDDCILIIRTLLIKTKRLLEIKKNQIKNQSLDEAISKHKPPIFWKDKEIVKNQIIKWKLKDTEKFVKEINDTELIVKKNYSNSLTVVSDFIINSAK